jgi:amidase
MAVRLPNDAQIADVAERIGLSLSPEDVSSIKGLLGGYVAAYNKVDRMIDPLPVV